MNHLIEALRFYDFRVYFWMYELGKNNHFWGSFFYFFALYGILFFFASFIYLIWKTRINALICSFFAMGIAGLTDLAITLVWKRPRPFIAHADVVNPDVSNLRVDFASFPSSHTYIAFAIATSIYLYGHKKLGAILFILAIFVAISRVGMGLHYLSDIIGGALLGVASGIIAHQIVHKAEKNWQ